MTTSGLVDRVLENAARVTEYAAGAMVPTDAQKELNKYLINK